ncbi:MAG: hypothetical protein IPG22_07690 [Acidobacteria bacterium]|nr:hypothetical protein [Acidobacteriota bacterium]
MGDFNSGVSTVKMIFKKRRGTAFFTRRRWSGSDHVSNFDTLPAKQNLVKSFFGEGDEGQLPTDST